MTPKQKYDERKRLRADRLLREEQVAKSYHDRQEDTEERLTRLMTAFERIADVLELWADQQGVTASVMSDINEYEKRSSV
jgi:hypothetical protein